MDNPFVMEQIFSIPRETVWEALADENKMRSWYFAQLKKFEPVVGFEFAFVNDGSAYQKQWRVTQVLPGKKLAHSWVYQGYRGASEVIFELDDDPAGTRLTLTHTGLDSFPMDPHFARERFEAGWKNIISVNLKRFIE